MPRHTRALALVSAGSALILTMTIIPRHEGLAARAATEVVSQSGEVGLVTPARPVAAATDDGDVLVWELHIQNGTPSGVQVERVDAFAGDRRVESLEGDDLLANLMVVSAEGRPIPEAGTIPPRGMAVVYLWHESPRGGAPPAISHRVAWTSEDGGAAVQVEGESVAVDRSGAVVLVPPLEGRNWLAANGPANDTGHRRAVIAAGGPPRIAQRFAIDFVQVIGESTFHGDPEDNRSYHAHGAPAFAVSDARVASTHDGIPENVPGLDSRAVEITLETIAGNYVILDLGGGRFAFYAHLQPGSLTVQPGEHVRSGEVLGLVGNSGNSTEPHLHFHVSDANSPLGSEGLPYLFDQYLLQDGADDETQTPPAEPGEPRSDRLPTVNQIVAFPAR